MYITRTAAERERETVGRKMSLRNDVRTHSSAGPLVRNNSYEPEAHNLFLCKNENQLKR